MHVAERLGMSNPAALKVVTLVVTSLALVSLAAGCEGQLGLATRSGITPPPRLMGHDAGPGSDGGVAADGALALSDVGPPVDAYWAPPDAYVPPSCVPSCSGRECGSNGCGGTCGSCASGSVCSPSFQCEVIPPMGGTHAVTLYGTATCGYCRRARDFFRDHDVTFTDRDLEAPGVLDEAFERVHDLTGEYRVSTPTVIVDDEVMLGWNEAEAARMLGL